MGTIGTSPSLSGRTSSSVAIWIGSYQTDSSGAFAENETSLSSTFTREQTKQWEDTINSIRGILSSSCQTCIQVREAYLLNRQCRKDTQAVASAKRKKRRELKRDLEVHLRDDFH